MEGQSLRYRRARRRNDQSDAPTPPRVIAAPHVTAAPQADSAREMIGTVCIIPSCKREIRRDQTGIRLCFCDPPSDSHVCHLECLHDETHILIKKHICPSIRTHNIQCSYGWPHFSSKWQFFKAFINITMLMAIAGLGTNVWSLKGQVERAYQGLFMLHLFLRELRYFQIVRHSILPILALAMNLRSTYAIVWKFIVFRYHAWVVTISRDKFTLPDPNWVEAVRHRKMVDLYRRSRNLSIHGEPEA